MMSKTVLAFLALFCTMQTMEASFWSDLAGGLRKLEDMIKDAVTKTEDNTSIVERDIKILMEMMYQKLREVVDNANTIGVDVSDCTREAEAKIRSIGQESEARYKKCLQDTQAGINGCSLLVAMYAEQAAEPVINDAEKCVKQKVSDAQGKDTQRDVYNGY